MSFIDRKEQPIPQRYQPDRLRLTWSDSSGTWVFHVNEPFIGRDGKYYNTIDALREANAGWDNQYEDKKNPIDLWFLRLTITLGLPLPKSTYSPIIKFNLRQY